MKKIITAFSIVIGVSTILTGCLKDTKFNNNEYGINDPAASPDGVGFTLGNTAVQIRSLEVSSSTQTISDLLILNLFAEKAATSDVTVTIVSDTSIVSAYNTANNTSTLQLPVTSYNVAPITTTIKAGQRLDTISLPIATTASLDPNKLYGVGLRIASVSNGYIIATNYSKIYVTLSIKNKYDGVYSVVSGSVQRYTAPGTPDVSNSLSGNLAGNPDISLITTGANSVGIPAPVSPNPGTLYWAFGNNSQVAGIDNVRIAIDATTNLLTTSSLGNATLANWEGKENRYDPATKTFYLNFRWNPNTNRREYSVVLKYKKPR